MKGKSSLLLMEQVVMLLVFAFAAAVCLKAFALSHEISRENEARDHAVTAAQNTAEFMKHHGGSAEDAFAAAAETAGGIEEQMYYVNYDANWIVTEEASVYRLEATEAETTAGLSGAEIRVLEQGEEEPLFSLTVLWQEVSYGR